MPAHVALKPSCICPGSTLNPEQGGQKQLQTVAFLSVLTQVIEGGWIDSWMDDDGWVDGRMTK